jgi:hypothetical protein
MDPVTAIVVALVMMAASLLISSMMMKHNQVKPAVLEDFDFPQIEEGTPEAVLFGQCWTPGWMVLWYGMLATVKIKSSGGKK